MEQLEAKILKERLGQVFKYLSSTYTHYAISGFTQLEDVDKTYCTKQDEEGYFFNHVYLHERALGVDDFIIAEVFIPIGNGEYLKCECTT